MPQYYLSGISCLFRRLSQSKGQVVQVLLTRSPLSIRRYSVRLACIRHAASVHPEPGSNSPFDIISSLNFLIASTHFTVSSENSNKLTCVSVWFSKNNFAPLPQGECAFLYYRNQPAMSTRFLTFFILFDTASDCSLTWFLAVSFYILMQRDTDVNNFFYFFSSFFERLKKCRKQAF